MMSWSVILLDEILTTYSRRIISTDCSGFYLEPIKCIEGILLMENGDLQGDRSVV